MPREISLLCSRFASALLLATIRFSYAAASSGVNTALFANSAGRSIGVTVRKSQIPCMSGLPSGVRGGFHFAAGAVDDDRLAACPETETAPIDTTAKRHRDVSTLFRMETSAKSIARL